MKRTVYIAGPMRGIPEFNFPAFDAAAALGRALGYEVISPAELDRESGFSEKGHDGQVNDRGHSEAITIDFMRRAAHRDFFAIIGTPEKPGVDAVALLPGWEKSRGAKAEKAMAEWIGLDVLDARTFTPLGETPFSNGPEITHQVGDLVIKDSGRRENFATGAVRDQKEGKGRYDLLPMHALERLAKVYEGGALKYGEENWRKGIPLRRFLDSALRHLCKFAQGQRDEDHAAMAAWNILSLIETEFVIGRGLLPADLANLPNFYRPA